MTATYHCGEQIDHAQAVLDRHAVSSDGLCVTCGRLGPRADHKASAKVFMLSGWGVKASGSGPLAALPTAPPGDVDLRHGYTLTTINRLAVAAGGRSVFHQSLPLRNGSKRHQRVAASKTFIVQREPVDGVGCGFTDGMRRG